MSEREMDRMIRGAAGVGLVESEPIPVVNEHEAQWLAGELGLTLSEARARLAAVQAGPPPTPPGNAGAGTRTAPQGGPDMDRLIRRAAGYAR